MWLMDAPLFFFGGRPIHGRFVRISNKITVHILQLRQQKAMEGGSQRFSTSTSTSTVDGAGHPISVKS